MIPCIVEVDEDGEEVEDVECSALAKVAK